MAFQELEKTKLEVAKINLRAETPLIEDLRSLLFFYFPIFLSACMGEK